MKKSSLFIILPLLLLSQLTSAGNVTRSQFTTNVIDREPIDNLQTVPSGLKKVTFFSELNNFDLQNITHQWVWHDTEMYRISFKVQGPRWRVWSSKRLMPKWKGTWTVNTLDEQGQIVQSQSFSY